MEEEKDLQSLIERLAEVDLFSSRMREHFSTEIAAAHPDSEASTANLVDYLALRSRDIRDIQPRLAALGLSSLGRSESSTRAALLAVLNVLHRLADQEPPEYEPPVISDSMEGRRLLARNADLLFGKAPPGHDSRIMVTLPAEAAGNYELIRELIEAGMNCARINCAHDDSETWRRLAQNVRAASRDLEKDCRIMMDLGGPKLRTGETERNPGVITWRVAKDKLGRVLQPSRVALASRREFIPDVAAVIPIESPLPKSFKPGTNLVFTDARGKCRHLEISEVDRERSIAFAETTQRAYVTPGTRIEAEVREKSKSETVVVSHFDGDLVRIPLQAGDTLILTDQSRTGTRGSGGTPAHIPCTLPEVFSSLRPGERVKFDDGKISGVIRNVGSDEIEIEIVQPIDFPAHLAPDKGINLPDSQLPISGLVDKDLEDLDVVAEISDMVALSFVNDPGDVRQLLEELENRGGDRLGVIVKIETKRGFDNLPLILLAGLSWNRLGVMIARGDLGVECGWERMAELQEEILWLCEAAHVPVIWATQVLESLAKRGLPARGEITDAAMSQRAECVMLNKGPHIVETVRMLKDILERMQDHQLKKTPMLRSLRVSEIMPDRPR